MAAVAFARSRYRFLGVSGVHTPCAHRAQDARHDLSCSAPSAWLSGPQSVWCAGEHRARRRQAPHHEQATGTASTSVRRSPRRPHRAYVEHFMQAHAEAPPTWFDTQHSRRNTAQHQGHWLTYFASSSREASFRVWSRMAEWICISISSFRVPHPGVAASSNVCHRARVIGKPRSG